MSHQLSALLFALIISFGPVFPAGKATAAMQGAATEAKQAASATASGTIVETMNSAGYTYMLVEKGTGKTWVAIPETTVAQGDKVEYYQGMVMEKFTSKTLNRTFDNLIFSPGLVGQKTGMAQQAARQPAANDSFAAAVNAEKSTVKSPEPVMQKSAGSAGAIAPLEEISIEKSTAANGHTVGEIFAEAKELDGKKVQVHGKVVKFSPMIMGKNWIHLQDGTGNPMENSHDLVATSGESVEVGSVVTVEGVLAADKDFGAGYKYAAIIEDASIIK